MGRISTSRARRVTFFRPGRRCFRTKSGVWKMSVPDPPQVRKSGRTGSLAIASMRSRASAVILSILSIQGPGLSYQE